MTASDGQTILDILDSDARGISTLAGRLADTTDSFDEDVQTVQLVREIVQNHVAAEQYLHPLIRRHLPEGEQIAHQQFTEHRKMEAVLRRLEDVDRASPEFRATLGEVRDGWTANADFLDREVFPALRDRCEKASLVQLADKALGAESSGPTRPRTFAVEQPAANALVSLTQGFVDKTIDAFTGRGHEGSDEIDARFKSGHYDDREG
jgi:hypothetical protein